MSQIHTGIFLKAMLLSNKERQIIDAESHMMSHMHNISQERERDLERERDRKKLGGGMFCMHVVVAEGKHVTQAGCMWENLAYEQCRGSDGMGTQLALCQTTLQAPFPALSVVLYHHGTLPSLQASMALGN